MIYINFINKIYSTIIRWIYTIIYGKRLHIRGDIFFRRGFHLIIEPNGLVEIGKGCFFNYNCSISCIGTVKIGENCIFGENVKIYDHNHNYKDLNELIKNQGFKIGNVAIGNNCWIGSNVVILSNVNIGDNVIIGSNCLIYKSIENNTIVKNKSELIINERH